MAAKAIDWFVVDCEAYPLYSEAASFADVHSAYPLLSMVVCCAQSMDEDYKRALDDLSLTDTSHILSSGRSETRSLLSANLSTGMKLSSPIPPSVQTEVDTTVHPSGIVPVLQVGNSVCIVLLNLGRMWWQRVHWGVNLT